MMGLSFKHCGRDGMEEKLWGKARRKIIEIYTYVYAKSRKRWCLRVNRLLLLTAMGSRRKSIFREWRERDVSSTWSKLVFR